MPHDPVADRPPPPAGLPAEHWPRRTARLTGTFEKVWEQALPHLDVRSNDVHSLYTFGLASALLDEVPQARPDVVLPAALLHDTGWKAVSPDQILAAVADPVSNRETVRAHEREGARIAVRILRDLGYPPELTADVAAIVDGHDTRDHSLGPDDAVVRDADKLWRLTPHGLRTIASWFGLDATQALRLVSERVDGQLLTSAARAMAGALGAVATIDVSPQRLTLDRRGSG
ncbi:HD domain-containing protein [Streptomyces sp. HM190]|uniref:HD domain-containing protein n=1 Tax=Streptomyces sp. HM190 TaxID=2695266 RepID=UPI001359A580|nr:HD domain-containing protein [Streptomyces sp. HM190]